MDINNPFYKDQGIHVILSLFTVKDGKFKVFLIQKKNQPFKDKWIMIGGACYNYEDTETALKREIFEKTGMKDINFQLCNIYSNPKRSPICRMLGVSYIGVIDFEKAKYLKETLKTKNADWFELGHIPELGYDHTEILGDAIEFLKNKMFDTAILKDLFAKYFTLPELHSAYQSILNKKIDRRNFRKNLINKKIIEDTGMVQEFIGKKPAKLYKFLS